MLLILIKKFVPCVLTMLIFSSLITLCGCVSCDSIPITEVTHKDESQSGSIAKKMSHLNNEAKVKLARARLYQKQGKFEKASLAYSSFIQMRDSFDTIALNEKAIAMQISTDVIDAQLSAWKMQHKLDKRKNSILSISTITLNTIGTLLLVLLLYCIRNHHHLQKYNTKLKAALIKAEEGVRIKENFMHHISHEISNPLKHIVGSSTLLDELHYKDKETCQYLDIIHESGCKLTDVISGILNVSDLQSKLLNEKFIMHKLDQLMVEIVEKYRSRVHEGVEICYTSSLSKDFTMLLRYDSSTVLLDSLVSNAVKYTYNGTITLNTSLDESKSTLIMTIQDTGVGVSNDDVDKIFNLFFKGNGYELGGGAGLFIAKQIAEGRKGTLELDKEYNKGARFILSVPLEVNK